MPKELTFWQETGGGDIFESETILEFAVVRSVVETSGEPCDDFARHARR